MLFKVVTPTLPRLDEVTYDTLVLSHFADERPLRGVGGLVDWRLTGTFSRLMLDGRLTGAWGEQLLYPQALRLPFRKIVVFGLGDRDKYGSTRFKEVASRMLRTLMRLECTSFATALPGRSSLKLVPRQLIDLWLGEFQKAIVATRYADLAVEIGFLEPQDVQGEISESLTAFARQHAQRG